MATEAWWIRGSGGTVQGPFSPLAIEHLVRSGQMPATTEVSDDRVMWAPVLMHPGFQRAVAPKLAVQSPGLAGRSVDWLSRQLDALTTGQKVLVAAIIALVLLAMFLRFGTW